MLQATVFFLLVYPIAFYNKVGQGQFLLKKQTFHSPSNENYLPWF